MWLSSHLSLDTRANDDEQKMDSQQEQAGKHQEESVANAVADATDSAASDLSQKSNNASENLSNLPYRKEDIVATWHVPLKGQIYRVEFEHGTTTGKRVIWVNRKAIFHREWMFKLVGDDVFQLEDIRCVLRVNPSPGFRYDYLLFVDGKPLKRFKETQAKALRTWETTVDDRHYRVVLEKETLNIYLNGDLREEEAEFVDVGTETRWTTDGDLFVLTARTSGNKREGIVHDLMVNGNLIEELSIKE